MKAVQSKFGKMIFQYGILGREVLSSIRNNNKVIIRKGKDSVVLVKQAFDKLECR